MRTSSSSPSRGSLVRVDREVYGGSDRAIQLYSVRDGVVDGIVSSLDVWELGVVVDVSRARGVGGWGEPVYLACVLAPRGIGWAYFRSLEVVSRE